MICCARYVWAHRTALARSVHDMAKQMYDNKLYSPKAWKPLSDWLFDCSEDEADRRSGVLTKFSNLDKEFFAVVARCLWELAKGRNLPWGRKADRACHYMSVPASEKVLVGLVRVGVSSFFFDIYI